jgi:hypothetical protein
MTPDPFVSFGHSSRPRASLASGTSTSRSTLAGMERSAAGCPCFRPGFFPGFSGTLGLTKSGTNDGAAGGMPGRDLSVAVSSATCLFSRSTSARATERSCFTLSSSLSRREFSSRSWLRQPWRCRECSSHIFAMDSIEPGRIGRDTTNPKSRAQ